MIDMLKRHEIQVLRRADHTWNEIATLTGVSVSTTQRVVAEDAVTTVDNAAERARREVGRPSKRKRTATCSCPDRAARCAVGRAAPPRPAGGLHGGKECGVCAGADVACPHRHAAGPI